MRRFMRFDNLGNHLGEVSANDVLSMTRRDVINGEHSLEIKTFQVLSKNERIVYQDGNGVWREYVVAGVDEEHISGNSPIGTYYCVWSIQVDLDGVIVSVMPGTHGWPVYASEALEDVLSEQSRWTIGSVYDHTTTSASMYDMTTWKALGILVQTWDLELDTTITIGSNGVSSRMIDLYDKMGESEAKRRFDFGADLNSVKRRFSDEPYYCRVSPRGKPTETEAGGYGRKIRINDDDPTQPDWLQYDPMVPICKLQSGNDYIYPTLIVECDIDGMNSNGLKSWAQSRLEEFCTPKVAYEVDAVHAIGEGVDVNGVSLGDVVQVVDEYFVGGLELSGRITEITVDELNERETTVKIGSFDEEMFGKSPKFTLIGTTLEIST